MRHRKHRHSLGLTVSHRAAVLSQLGSALIEHGRIKTTLAKAKALRPFIERIITLAKKAHLAEEPPLKLRYRRSAIVALRDKLAVTRLFDELAQQFVDRAGGYTRIYKLAPRLKDAAKLALIELVPASDKPYASNKKLPNKST